MNERSTEMLDYEAVTKRESPPRAERCQSVEWVRWRFRQGS